MLHFTTTATTGLHTLNLQPSTLHPTTYTPNPEPFTPKLKPDQTPNSEPRTPNPELHTLNFKPHTQVSKQSKQGHALPRRRGHKRRRLPGVLSRGQVAFERGGTGTWCAETRAALPALR